MKPSFPRVLVISKRTAYDYYVRRHRMARVRKLLSAGDPSVARLVRADEQHRETLEELRDVVRSLGLRARFRDRSQMGSLEDFDLVMTVGGDGTLLSTSHRLGDTPILGVNSAPMDSVGYLCGAKRDTMRRVLEGYLDGSVRTTKLARMRVSVDDKVAHNRVLNDVLYAHKNPAMMSRYLIRDGQTLEEQRSSGIWIGPATGSTAAIRSAGGRPLPLRSLKLQYVVREGYHPRGEVYRHNRGLIPAGSALEVWNQMREGMLYLDGPRQPIPLQIGQRVRFELSDESLYVVGFMRKASTEYDPQTSARAGKRRLRATR